MTEAIDRLAAHYNNLVEFYLDHDIKEVPGYPNIVQAIQQKVILESDVYIADFPVVNRTTKEKAIINPNVLDALSKAIECQSQYLSMSKLILAQHVMKIVLVSIN